MITQKYHGNPPIDTTPDQWQPIESAPRDGSMVLVWHKDYEYGMGVSYYSDVYEMFMVGKDRPQPTHWMPLPKPPKGV